jgi:hypothetical protein
MQMLQGTSVIALEIRPRQPKRKVKVVQPHPAAMRSI